VSPLTGGPGTNRAAILRIRTGSLFCEEVSP